MLDGLSFRKLAGITQHAKKLRLSSNFYFHLSSSWVALKCANNEKGSCMPSVALRLLRGHALFTKRSDVIAQFRLGLCSRSRKTYKDIASTAACIPEVLDFGALVNIGEAQQIEKTTKVKHNLRRIAKIGSVANCWQSRLRSFEAISYESALDQPPLHGRRLVDLPHVQSTPELWLELLRFRERINGLEGVAMIWQGFRDRAIALHQDDHLKTLWANFLRLGFIDHRVLGELCDYINGPGKELRRITVSFHYLVLKHMLETKPTEAYEWHLQLKRYLLYSPHRRKLFDVALADAGAMAAFMQIYEENPYPDDYSMIVSKLCARDRYSDALSWHRLFTKGKTVLADAAAAEPVLLHFASSDQIKLVAQVRQGMEDKGVVIPAASVPKFEKPSLVIHQVLDGVPGNLHDIKPKTPSDEFCAKLFATKMFSVQTIISGLRMFGINAIGPLSLREIATRAVENDHCHPETVVQSLQHLYEADISIGTSKFSRLIKKATHENNTQLLYDVILCDQHPEVYEDRNLQESLLAAYHRTGDQRQISRTLAILTLDEHENSLDVVHWNLLLRSYITLGDSQGVLDIVQKMFDNSITLTKRSRIHMWNQTVSVRRVSKGPKTILDLPRLIRIWRRFMRSGTYFPPEDWVEILRRLGMRSQLDDYERLALWLAKWYTNEKFRDSQSALAMQQESVKKPFMYKFLPKQEDKKHPLQILFPTAMQQAVIAWGFRSVKTTHKTRVLARSPALWGLRLLVKLRNLGMDFDQKVVARACKIRLIIMFGPGISKRRVNRSSVLGKHSHWEDYALAMEQVWGSNLFDSFRAKQMDAGEEPDLRLRSMKW